MYADINCLRQFRLHKTGSSIKAARCWAGAVVSQVLPSGVPESLFGKPQ